MAVILIAEVALTPRHDLEHELLHPCCSAAHLRYNKHVFWLRLVLLCSLEHFFAADLRRTAHPLVFERRHYRSRSMQQSQKSHERNYRK